MDTTSNFFYNYIRILLNYNTIVDELTAIITNNTPTVPTVPTVSIVPTVSTVSVYSCQVTHDEIPVSIIPNETIIRVLSSTVVIGEFRKLLKEGGFGLTCNDTELKGGLRLKCKNGDKSRKSRKSKKSKKSKK